MLEPLLFLFADFPQKSRIFITAKTVFLSVMTDVTNNPTSDIFVQQQKKKHFINFRVCEENAV
jgi:hypothetical protein